MRKKVFFHFYYVISFLLFFILFLVIFSLRLFYLQIIKGEYYYKLSLDNILKYRTIPAPRGLIFDRNHNLLVKNKEVTQLFIPSKYLKKYYPELSKFLNLNPLPKKHSFLPFLAKSNLSYRETAKILVNLEKFPQIILKKNFVRKYIVGEPFGHIIGFVNLISKEEYLRLKDKNYSFNDYIGKMGIEKEYENLLRGKKGEEIYIKNIKTGSSITYKLIKAVAGKNLWLTIDKDLQMKCWKLLNGRKGCIIISNPNNGEILAFVSYPSYNPQYFIEPKKELLPSKMCMFNRGIQGKYAPGSTFKLFTAYFALKNNIVTPDKKFYCNKKYYYGKWPYPFTCDGWHGWVNLEKAIKVSCNVYFYNIGAKIKIMDFYTEALKFPLSHKTGIDLPFETTPLFPSPGWKKRVFKEIWYPGDTLYLSIGQSYLLETPINILAFYNIIATSGKYYKLHLLKKIENPDGKSNEIKSRLLNDFSSDEKIWKILQKGLYKVVNEKGGTAYSARSKKVKFAGKTGTAENPHGKPHSWFVGYAPYDNPQISFVIFIENGGHGGEIAAPIAKKIVEWYFFKY